MGIDFAPISSSHPIQIRQTKNYSRQVKVVVLLLTKHLAMLCVFSVYFWLLVQVILNELQDDETTQGHPWCIQMMKLLQQVGVHMEDCMVFFCSFGPLPSFDPLDSCEARALYLLYLHCSKPIETMYQVDSRA